MKKVNRSDKYKKTKMTAHTPKKPTRSNSVRHDVANLLEAILDTSEVTAHSVRKTEQLLKERELI